MFDEWLLSFCLWHRNPLHKNWIVIRKVGWDTQLRTRNTQLRRLNAQAFYGRVLIGLCTVLGFDGFFGTFNALFEFGI